MFFWWKKYEFSWVATFISFSGTILVTLGSFALAAALVSMFSDNTALVVIGVIICVAVFVALKILLNKITDMIDDKLMVRLGKKVAKNAKYKNKSV